MTSLGDIAITLARRYRTQSANRVSRGLLRDTQRWNRRSCPRHGGSAAPSAGRSHLGTRLTDIRVDKNMALGVTAQAGGPGDRSRPWLPSVAVQTTKFTSG